jgi:hypothetical protein
MPLKKMKETNKRTPLRDRISKNNQIYMAVGGHDGEADTDPNKKRSPLRDRITANYILYMAVGGFDGDEMK